MGEKEGSRCLTTGEIMNQDSLIWEKRLFSLFIFLVLTGAVLAAWPWTLRASLIVLVLGGVGVVLALLQVVSEFKPAGESPQANSGMSFETPRLQSDDRWGNLEIWGWMLGFFVAIHLIGFLTTIPLFVLVYSKIYGAGWLTSLALSLLCWGFVYAVFEELMHVPWPRALLFSLF
jgi:hypothetical protein